MEDDVLEILKNHPMQKMTEAETRIYHQIWVNIRDKGIKKLILIMIAQILWTSAILSFLYIKFSYNSALLKLFIVGTLVGIIGFAIALFFEKKSIKFKPPLEYKRCLMFVHAFDAKQKWIQGEYVNNNKVRKEVIIQRAFDGKINSGSFATLVISEKPKRKLVCQDCGWMNENADSKQEAE